MLWKNILRNNSIFKTLSNFKRTSQLREKRFKKLVKLNNTQSIESSESNPNLTLTPLIFKLNLTNLIWTLSKKNLVLLMSFTAVFHYQLFGNCLQFQTSWLKVLFSFGSKKEKLPLHTIWWKDLDMMWLIKSYGLNVINQRGQFSINI